VELARVVVAALDDAPAKAAAKRLQIIRDSVWPLGPTAERDAVSLDGLVRRTQIAPDSKRTLEALHICVEVNLVTKKAALGKLAPPATVVQMNQARRLFAHLPLWPLIMWSRTAAWPPPPPSRLVVVATAQLHIIRRSAYCRLCRARHKRHKAQIVSTS
jgi:hypothetical protein